MTDYLSPLNPAQRKAVETLDGPVLILAGAGTGKTRVLTTRFAHILMSGKAQPWQILTVTFTNKAAREMRERIAALINRPVEGLWLGTFHSLCVRILRKHAQLAGLTPEFTILDTDDQLRLLKQALEPLGIDTKRYTPPVLMGIIQRWKDRGLTPEQVTPAEENDNTNGYALKAYKNYQSRLLQLNACDFGDLLLHTTQILKNNPTVLGEYQRLFHYMLVDEYQDTNTVQYLWLRLLALRTEEPANICCVGDDDQSIYSWRGANIQNILQFEKDFPGAKIIRLESNYRSTPAILSAASTLISHNQGRLGKTLYSSQQDPKHESGEKIQIYSTHDSDEEALLVAKETEKLSKEGHSLGEMAILMRAGFQTRSFEEKLITFGIPYRVIGGMRFYERAEIRDGLAYLRILRQPSDDLALERIINLPRRGVGSVALQKFHHYAKTHNIPLLAAVRAHIEQKLIKGKSANELTHFLEVLENSALLLERDGPIVAAEHLLEESGYLPMWRNDLSLEAPGRVDNLKELVRAMTEFETLEGFLEHVSLVMENDENTENTAKISLMTLHGAKGLEFDTVFLPGWEENIFPSQRTLEESGLEGLEEERRLAYVGLTRARQRIIITHAANRRMYGGWQSSLPSRFLEELPEEHILHQKSALVQREHRLMAPSMHHHMAYSPRSLPSRSASNPYSAAYKKQEPITVFSEGERVFHQKFGYGTIKSQDGEKLDVIFDKAGLKHVLGRFLEQIP
ncbi:ATP-dependent helicase [Entomobacter blattae]|uniref:DNA 3'-5' helicase n=1 Tax=Entomobacter blattae TaxID=2762277 RepID=A0A7H1NSA6_9PROT|nr:UvrD-helicase domain-containing protein [Entomobacter blattae]QNT78666.1 ATP-dependent DNA helicase PcrA [Entomobacter blattae]